MKSKLLLVMLTLMTCLLAQTSDAQTRYQDSIFASYTLDSVVYSPNTGYKMDIYQPAGDVAATRPVVMLAHGGTFVSGDRHSDVTVVRLCKDLAHRGYVTVSIDYTLANPITNMLDSNLASIEVFKAIADARAAVRYLFKDAATTNTYKVDTNNIFIGGNSAGGVLGLHYAYVTNTAQFHGRRIFLTAVDTIGGTLEGNRGNPGYNSKVKGVISLSGGLNEAGWIDQCSVPLVGAHGSADATVPYTCAFPVIFGIPVPLQLCGLGSYGFYLNNNVPYSSSIIFQGAGHVPWDTNAHMYYQVDTLITGFLYKEVTGAAPTSCVGFPAGIAGIGSDAALSIYPNPASSVLNIHSSATISSISVLDEMGRVVSQVADLHSLDYQLNTSRLSAGIYFVKVENGLSSSLRKVVIE
jgi:para-nitrobenzyl esterase